MGKRKEQKERKKESRARFLETLFSTENGLAILLELSKCLPTRHMEKFCEALFPLAEYHDHTYDLIARFCLDEMQRTNQSTTLFRESTYAPMLMKLAVLTVGRSYLQRTFCDSLEEVRSLAGDDIMEIKAERTDPDTLKRNLQRLKMCLDVFLHSIYQSYQDCPFLFRKLCVFLLEEMPCHCKDQPTETAWRFVGAFMFLRFFVPAICDPVRYGILDEAPPLVFLRNLINISKAMQNLANGTPFGEDADGYADFNRYILSHGPQVKLFVERLGTIEGIHAPIGSDVEKKELEYSINFLLAAFSEGQIYLAERINPSESYLGHAESENSVHDSDCEDPPASPRSLSKDAEGTRENREGTVNQSLMHTFDRLMRMLEECAVDLRPLGLFENHEDILGEDLRLGRPVKRKVPKVNLSPADRNVTLSESDAESFSREDSVGGLSSPRIALKRWMDDWGHRREKEDGRVPKSARGRADSDKKGRSPLSRLKRDKSPPVKKGRNRVSSGAMASCYESDSDVISFQRRGKTLDGSDLSDELVGNRRGSNERSIPLGDLGRTRQMLDEAVRQASRLNLQVKELKSENEMLRDRNRDLTEDLRDMQAVVESLEQQLSAYDCSFVGTDRLLKDKKMRKGSSPLAMRRSEETPSFDAVRIARQKSIEAAVEDWRA